MKTENKYYLFLSAITILLIGMLFQETFQGLVLQGVDDNISMRQVLIRSLQSGQGYHFIPNYWLGFIFNVPNPDFYNSILALTGNVRVVGVFILALIVSVFVSYKLMRRLEISPTASIFGAISYSFLPHVLSLVHSGHALALEAIPMTPAFLLCITIILDGKTSSLPHKILAGIWGGIFWAWMMIGEPQRGIYGTVLGIAWVLYLSFRSHLISIKPKFSFDIIKIKKTVPFLLITLVVGLAIFLSTIKFWANSEFLANQGSWEFSTSWSFPPTELLDSLAFGYHGLTSSDYNFFYWGDKPMSGNTDSLGFFLIVFSFLAMIFIRNSKRYALMFFSIAGLVALLLSFGKYMPGKPLFWLWYHLPGMDKLRVPAKFLSITGLSWAIVAAMGLDFLSKVFQSKEKNNLKTQQVILWCIGSVVAVSALWILSLIISGGGDPSPIRAILRQKLNGQNPPREFVDIILSGKFNAVLSMFALFFSLFASIVLIHLKPNLTKYFSWIIIALTAFNLYSSNRYYTSTSYIDEQKFYQKTPMISFLETNLSTLYRGSGSLFLPNTTESPAPIGSVIEQGLYSDNNRDLTYAFPYFDINMFGRIPISRIDENYRQFFKSAYDSVGQYVTESDIWELNKRLWFVGNVKYIIVGSQLDQVFQKELSQDADFVQEFISENKTNKIYQLKNVLPRFAEFENVKPVYDLYLFDELTTSLTDISNFKIPVDDLGLNLTSSNYGFVPAKVERLDYNSYKIDVQNPSNHILYFGDLYDKGWIAEVDGQKTSVYRANGIQQFILVPENSKEIKYYYKRPVQGLLFSRILIILSIIGVIILWVFSLKNPKEEENVFHNTQ